MTKLISFLTERAASLCVYVHIILICICVLLRPGPPEKISAKGGGKATNAKNGGNFSLNGLVLIFVSSQKSLKGWKGFRKQDETHLEMEDFVGPPPLGLGERGNLHEGPNLVTTEFFRIFTIDFNGGRIRPKKTLKLY